MVLVDNYMLTKTSPKLDGWDIQTVSWLLITLTSYVTWERFTFLKYFNTCRQSYYPLETFLIAVWLPHCQLWVIIRCKSLSFDANHCVLSMFDRKVTVICYLSTFMYQQMRRGYSLTTALRLPDVTRFGVD